MKNDSQFPHVSDVHPGSGLDAAFAGPFDRPLIAKIREMVAEIIFQDRVRRHPDRYPDHPRAAAILARAAMHAHARAVAGRPEGHALRGSAPVDPTDHSF